jgi:hypothetical protein
MEVKRNDNADDNPLIVIEGMEPIIQKDLDKHKEILEQAKISLGVFKQAVSHEVKKKKYYKSLIGGKKFNDEALKRSIGDININIRHMSDKVKLTQDKIAFETNIVDTLTNQLKDYRESVNKLAEYRMKQAARDAINSRLGESAN